MGKGKNFVKFFPFPIPLPFSKLWVEDRYYHFFVFCAYCIDSLSISLVAISITSKPDKPSLFVSNLAISIPTIFSIQYR